MSAKTEIPFNAKIAVAVGAAALVLFASAGASAGPPYLTDDPEPVPYRHWELYLAGQIAHEADGWSGTGPHVEVNYGAVADVQLHLIAPLAFSLPDKGAAQYGPGDIELGAKVRLVHETEWIPQVGTFPLIELPSGSEARGLGGGHVQLFLPIWIQKSFGPWTTYGGAGFWINPGAGNRDYGFFGWQAQRRLADALTIGAEVFHTTPKQDGESSETRFNIGMIVDLGETHHLLFSWGRGIPDLHRGQAYVAYQATFGPEEASH